MRPANRQLVEKQNQRIPETSKEVKEQPKDKYPTQTSPFSPTRWNFVVPYNSPLINLSNSSTLIPSVSLLLPPLHFLQLPLHLCGNGLSFVNHRSLLHIPYDPFSRTFKKAHFNPTSVFPFSC